MTEYFNKDAAEGDYTGTNRVFHTGVFLLCPSSVTKASFCPGFRVPLGGSIAGGKSSVSVRSRGEHDELKTNQDASGQKAMRVKDTNRLVMLFSVKACGIPQSWQLK